MAFSRDRVGVESGHVVCFVAGRGLVTASKAVRLERGEHGVPDVVAFLKKRLRSRAARSA